ncbi:hypothetical protein BDA96_01G097100 [Sorghum bicolor]|uniref:Uncharacterized protein n=1 Tax=Sorghum bicolor TaxID=4558 RepID=A0A921UXP0_SORBI|nr:hypothetical protein BDA96_01G097100 [Sorghum bicolor]
MPRIGDPDANSLHKVTWEFLFLFGSIAVCYFQREYIRPGRPDLLPKFIEFGVGLLGLWGFAYSGIYRFLDGIDSPRARLRRRGRNRI